MGKVELIQLGTALLGSLGFALFFNMPSRHIAVSALGGFLTWLVYWLLNQVVGQPFVPCLVASSFAAAYAECLARKYRVPSSIFFIIGVIPLIPGRGLFFTMSDAVHENWTVFYEHGTTTLLFAAGIAAGICIIAACVQTAKFARRRVRRLAAAAVAKTAATAKKRH